MSARHTPTPAKLPHTAAHVPFSRLNEDLQRDPGAEFAETALDVALGLGLCLEMVCNSQAERDANEGAYPDRQGLPLLNLYDTERMLHFAIASARLLAGAANNQIGFLNKHGVTLGSKNENK